MPQRTSHNHFLHIALELLEIGVESEFSSKKEWLLYLLLCASGYVAVGHPVINIDNTILTPNIGDGDPVAPPNV